MAVKRPPRLCGEGVSEKRKKAHPAGVADGLRPDCERTGLLFFRAEGADYANIVSIIPAIISLSFKNAAQLGRIRAVEIALHFHCAFCAAKRVAADCSG